MKKEDFSYLRKKLLKTQKEMARLLGKSIKAIQGYEQGWRLIPGDIERQIYFLATQAYKNLEKQKPCWRILKCPPKKKKNCPAWEFKTGQLCWFINGTICAGEPQKHWKEKIDLCKKCDFFVSLLKQIDETDPD